MCAHTRHTVGSIPTRLFNDSVAKWEGKGVQNPDTSCSNQTRVSINQYKHRGIGRFRPGHMKSLMEYDVSQCQFGCTRLVSAGSVGQDHQVNYGSL